MSQRQKLTGPVMRRATGFNAHKARWQLRKKRQNLRAADRPADDDPARRVHSMDLKNVLRQIQANGANFHDGWLLRLWDVSIPSTPWHSDAVSGSHPHHLHSSDSAMTPAPREKRPFASSAQGRPSAACVSMAP